MTGLTHAFCLFFRLFAFPLAKCFNGRDFVMSSSWKQFSGMSVDGDITINVLRHLYVRVQSLVKPSKKEKKNDNSTKLKAHDYWLTCLPRTLRGLHKNRINFLDEHGRLIPTISSSLRHRTYVIYQLCKSVATTRRVFPAFHFS